MHPPRTACPDRRRALPLLATAYPTASARSMNAPSDGRPQNGPPVPAQAARWAQVIPPFLRGVALDDDARSRTRELTSSCG